MGGGHDNLQYNQHKNCKTKKEESRAEEHGTFSEASGLEKSSCGEPRGARSQEQLKGGNNSLLVRLATFCNKVCGHEGIASTSKVAKAEAESRGKTKEDSRGGCHQSQ